MLLLTVLTHDGRSVEEGPCSVTPASKSFPRRPQKLSPKHPPTHGVTTNSKSSPRHLDAPARESGHKLQLLSSASKGLVLRSANLGEVLAEVTDTLLGSRIFLSSSVDSKKKIIRVKRKKKVIKYASE